MAKKPSNTAEGIADYAASRSLEDLLRDFNWPHGTNHISITTDKDGKATVSIFRDTIGPAPYRYMTGTDVVDVAKRALASVLITRPEEAPPAKRGKAPPAPADEDDLI